MKKRAAFIGAMSASTILSYYSQASFFQNRVKLQSDTINDDFINNKLIDDVFKSLSKLPMPLKPSRTTFKDILFLSTEAYNISSMQLNQKIDGWQLIVKSINPKTGYHGGVFKKGEDIVIAHKGSGSLINLQSLRDDWVNMNLTGIVALAERNQSQDAWQLSKDTFEKIQTQNPDYKGCSLSMTGHSLGGWLAYNCSRHLAIEKSVLIPVRLIDPPGSVSLSDKRSVSGKGTKLDVINYFVSPNPVNMLDKHDGTCLQVKDKSTLKSLKRLESHAVENFKMHENNQDLLLVNEWPTISTNHGLYYRTIFALSGLVGLPLSFLITASNWYIKPDNTWCYRIPQITGGISFLSILLLLPSLKDYILFHSNNITEENEIFSSMEGIYTSRKIKTNQWILKNTHRLLQSFLDKNLKYGILFLNLGNIQINDDFTEIKKFLDDRHLKKIPFGDVEILEFSPHINAEKICCELASIIYAHPELLFKEITIDSMLDSPEIENSERRNRWKNYLKNNMPVADNIKDELKELQYLLKLLRETKLDQGKEVYKIAERLLEIIDNSNAALFKEIGEYHFILAQEPSEKRLKHMDLGLDFILKCTNLDNYYLGRAYGYAARQSQQSVNQVEYVKYKERLKKSIELLTNYINTQKCNNNIEEISKSELELAKSKGELATLYGKFARNHKNNSPKTFEKYMIKKKKMLLEVVRSKLDQISLNPYDYEYQESLMQTLYNLGIVYIDLGDKNRSFNIFEKLFGFVDALDKKEVFEQAVILDRHLKFKIYAAYSQSLLENNSSTETNQLFQTKLEPKLLSLCNELGNPQSYLDEITNIKEIIMKQSQKTPRI